MIERVDGASVGNIPNNSAENVKQSMSNITARNLFESGKPYEDMTPEERAIYNAMKEENDPEFLKSVGRLEDSVIRPVVASGNSYPKARPTLPGPDPNTTIVNGRQLEHAMEAPMQQPDRTIVPRPPFKPSPSSNSFKISAVKDELTVPFAAVAKFMNDIMGGDFGYISRTMAKSIIALVPKEAALLAINTSKDDAKKFLDHEDETIRKEAIKKYFDTSDEGVEAVQKLLDTPGFEINPWKE